MWELIGRFLDIGAIYFPFHNESFQFSSTCHHIYNSSTRLFELSPFEWNCTHVCDSLPLKKLYLLQYVTLWVFKLHFLLILLNFDLLKPPAKNSLWRIIWLMLCQFYFFTVEKSKRE
jgi:hypothetical protein